MLLSKKYYNDFVEMRNNPLNTKTVLNQIIKIEKETGIEMLKWSKVEYSKYLSSFESTSPISIRQYDYTLKYFAKFICEQEKIDVVDFEFENIKYEDFIDIEKVLSRTISYEQYITIKNQLTVMDGAVERNYRDKVIFELGWSGLTNEEIKMLKESDITESLNELEDTILILNLTSTDRIVRIEDPEIVEDIKKCILETEYLTVDKNGMIKRPKYRESEYLIKPVNVGRCKPETYLNNPGLTLSFVLEKVQCEGIDLDGLTLEDIKRSKIIYLMMGETKDYFDNMTLMSLFGLNEANQLTWWKTVGELKYNTK
jgi:hypothetical protein